MSIEFREKVEEMITSFCSHVEKKTLERIQHIPFDPVSRETHEVVGALLSRQATLCCELGRNPNAWTGHIAPLILRSMADLYITFAWILKDKQERARQYIRYALGTVKLEIEYRKSVVGETPTEAEQQIIDAKTAWLNSQRFDFLTEVNVGSWSGKSTREMAKEAGCEDFYRFVYEPFSACVHNTWVHTEGYNTEYCRNELHIPHRLPCALVESPDVYYLFLGAKYLDKTFRIFDREFNAKDETESVHDFLDEILGELTEERTQEPRGEP